MATVVSPTGLLPVVFDPDGIDPLDINDGAGYIVHADLSMPPPAQKPQYASSVDTEGSRPVPNSAHYENREIVIKVRVYGDSDFEVEDRLAALYTRLGRVHRKGGVLGVTTPAGRTIFFDLVGEADADTTFDDRWLKLNKTDVEIRLTAAPFWRGPELEYGRFTATASNEPALLITTDPVPGDVAALGRLVVTDLQGADQWQVRVGWQNDTYSPNPEANLYYVAEDLTPMGSSTTPGLGLITNSDLIPTYQAIMSSKYRPTGAHLEHHGSYKVMAFLFRPQSNTGRVSVQLDWGEGDLRRRTVNEAVTFLANDRENNTTITDLGTVHISPDADRWEFQILASAQVPGDELSVAAIMLFPTDDGYIELSGEPQFDRPYALSAHDEFNQTNGSNLNGLTAPQGGGWVTSGGAGDFVVTAGVTAGNEPTSAVWRQTVSEANLLAGRYAILGAVATSQSVQNGFICASRTSTAGKVRQATFARLVDSNNWLMAGYDFGGSSSNEPDQFFIAKRVAGTVTDLVRFNQPAAIATPYTIRIQVDAFGRWYVWAFLSFSSPGAPFSGQDDVLAPGGALDDGKGGFYDANTGTVAVVRATDDFLMYSPPAGALTADAAIFAGRNLELAHDRARRQSIDGETTSDVSRRAGRYLRLNPGINRLIIKAMRNEPTTMTNGFVDDIQGELWVTPRGLVVPAS